MANVGRMKKVNELTRMSKDFVSRDSLSKEMRLVMLKLVCVP